MNSNSTGEPDEFETRIAGQQGVQIGHGNKRITISGGRVEAETDEASAGDDGVPDDPATDTADEDEQPGGSTKYKVNIQGSKNVIVGDNTVQNNTF